jgi:hypothetical protein
MPDNSLRDELADVLNRHNIDTLYDVPVHILADLLVNNLAVFGRVTRANREWHGYPTLAEKLGLTGALDG